MYACGAHLLHVPMHNNVQPCVYYTCMFSESCVIILYNIILLLDKNDNKLLRYNIKMIDIQVYMYIYNVD